MKLKKKNLYLQNVISHSGVLPEGVEKFTYIEELTSSFKKELINQGFYSSGPIIFQVDPYNQKNTNFQFLISFGNEFTQQNVKMDKENILNYQKKYEILPCYMYRHIDLEEEIPYDAIKKYIEKDKKSIISVTHCVLDFYSETILDIYFEYKDVL